MAEKQNLARQKKFERKIEQWELKCALINIIQQKHKDIKKLGADQIAAKDQLQKENCELQTKLKYLEQKVDYFERAKRLKEIPLLLASVKERQLQDQAIWEQKEKKRIAFAIEEHKIAVATKERLERMKPDKDSFLNKLLKERNVVYEDKLKEFEKKLSEERRRRLAQRKSKRKEDRRNKYLQEKEEEEIRKREEQARMEEEARLQKEEAARKEREEMDRFAREEKERKLDEDDDIKKLDADQIAAKEAEELQKERCELQAKLKSLEKKGDYFERAKRLQEIPLLLASVKERQLQDQAFWEHHKKERIALGIEERKVAVATQERMERMKPDKDSFLDKLLKERNVVYEDKLKEFEKKLSEERRRRLAQRKSKRNEDRRNKYLQEKEEEIRKREEQARMEEEARLQKEEAARMEREEMDRFAREEKDRKRKEQLEMLQRVAAKQRAREEIKRKLLREKESLKGKKM